MRKLGLAAACLGWVAASAVMASGVAVAQAGEARGTAGGTQAKRPMTFADLMAMKRVSDPQVSPSGKWVLFSVTEVSLAANSKVNHLCVVPMEGQGPRAEGQGGERPVTSGAGESNGRFSPDGKWVSFTQGDQVWVAPFAEAEGTLGQAHALTTIATGADGAIWSPDSRRLLFVSSVHPECSDKATFAEEDACDKARDAAAEASPVKAQVFEHLLYRHWNAFTGEKRSHIFVVSADGSGVRDLTPRSAVGDAETPTFSLGGPLGYAWSPDSKEVAYETNLEVGFAKPGVGLQPGESTNNDIFTLRLDEPGAKAVKVSTSPGSDDGPQYSPDGKWLAWRSQARDGYESDKFGLEVMDRAKQTVEPINIHLSAPPDKLFDGWVDEFAWSPDGYAILFTSAFEGQEAIFSVDFHGFSVRGNALFVKFTRDGEYGDLRVADTVSKHGDQRTSSTKLIATYMRADRPAEIVLHDAGLVGHTAYTIAGRQRILDGYAGNPIRLTHLNEDLENRIALVPQESFWFDSANGDKVQGFLVKPPNFDPAKKYPVKFLIHGGPQGAWGDAWSYRWNPELFAADGYVVVMVNPHGSTGYGQKFVEEVSGDWGGLPYSDLMRGLDYAEQHYSFIDKDRECALGASYGGFMANWVLTHTDRFKCIVTHDGMYNPQSAFGTTEELWFNEWEFRPKTGNRGQGAGNREGDAVEQGKPARPWDFYAETNAQDPFRKFSPMLAIRNAHTPTLVVHGQRDYRLDVSEGYQLFTALQLLGVPSKMLYFPDEGHWVLKPQNSQLWYATVNDWCDRWLGMGKYREQGTGIREQGLGMTGQGANGAVPRVGR